MFSHGLPGDGELILELSGAGERGSNVIAWREAGRPQEERHEDAVERWKDAVPLAMKMEVGEESSPVKTHFVG